MVASDLDSDVSAIDQCQTSGRPTRAPGSRAQAGAFTKSRASWTLGAGSAGSAARGPETTQQTPRAPAPSPLHRQHRGPQPEALKSARDLERGVRRDTTPPGRQTIVQSVIGLRRLMEAPVQVTIQSLPVLVVQYSVGPVCSESTAIGRKAPVWRFLRPWVSALQSKMPPTESLCVQLHGELYEATLP